MQENSKKRSIGTKGKITGSGNIDDDHIKNVVEVESEDSPDDHDAQVKRIKVNDKSVAERSNSDDTKVDVKPIMSGLPSDFFNNDSSKSVEVPPSDTTEKPSKDSSTLPADFFDNSSKTSSSKQEKSADEIEEEWVLFQKLISKETQVSNQIAYEDEEELQRDRDEMLEREQEMCFKRSERLKEVAKKVRENREQKMIDIVKKDIDESDDDNDEDVGDDFENEWMDWRAQRIL
ncbi:zinc finger protein [Gigaspora margarita]|uniref:Zinc finger protein n=1 Tax=Gigaspora margarita TaxID=4874 RepID=A0A8H4AGW9_GIGMA|nr:zinc finger protein [Gigaspora margarita]